jgi:general secretion pathway protein B
MSFILDALRKAESERSRHTGPVLMDVRVVAPRQRLPIWAWIFGGVLLATLLVQAWLLLRTREQAPLLAATAQQTATVQQPGAAAPASSPPASAASGEPVVAPPDPAVVLPVPAPAPAASTPAPAQAAMPQQLPSPAPVYPLLPRIDNLPTAQDLVAQGVALPALTLNLHVYDEAPANRYVLLNARRLREGDEVAEGIRVETIVPGGVVLNARGRRFLLLAGG